MGWTLDIKKSQGEEKYFENGDDVIYGCSLRWIRSLAKLFIVCPSEGDAQVTGRLWVPWGMRSIYNTYVTRWLTSSDALRHLWLPQGS